MTTKKRDQAIINKIVAQFSARSRVEIDQWRDAVKEAENIRMPRRAKWHDILRDIKLDTHLHAQVQVRELQMICRQFRIIDKKSGKEIPEKTAMLQSPWLYQLMRLDNKSIMSGTCVGEIDQVLADKVTDVYHIPDKHISPDTQEFLVKHTDRSGYFYPDDAYIIEFREEEFMGLICKAAPLIIWKKNALQSWAEFCEKFGIPMRYAITNKRDKATIDRIEKMLKSLGAAAQAVFPEGTTIDFKEAQSKDAFNVFDKLIERANSEVSKLINGVTMITDDGPSRSQSAVHQKINSNIIKADAMRFKSRMNFEILPKLFALGFPINPDTDQFDWDDTESLPKNEQWKIVQGVLDHYLIPDDWITEQFGIPIERKKETNHSQQAFNTNRQKMTMTMADPLIPYYATCSHAPVSNMAITKAYEDKLKILIDRIRNDDANLEDIPLDLHLEKGGKLIEQVKKGFNDRLTAIEYDSPDHLRMAMYEANLFQFSAASSYKEQVTLNNLAREADTAFDFIEKAKEHTQVSLKYAVTEYDQAFITSQNAANWIRQQEDKQDYDLEYQTIGDSLVRNSHATLDGIVAPIDDDIWNTIYPPNGWNCRCEVVQIPKGSKATASDAKRAESVDYVAKGFKMNPGKITHIFEDTHAHFKEFPDEKRLNRRKYGLPSWTDLDRSDMKPISDNIANTDQYKAWWNDEVQRIDLDNTHIYYKNYLGLYLRLDKAKLYEKFQAQRYEGQNRMNIATHVEEILQRPDEVWINNTQLRHLKNGKYQATYLKNYADGTYAVITNGDDDLKVTTWYKIDEYEEKGKKISISQNLGNHRNGILLKSNEE